MTERSDLSIAVLGAGPGGICMGIRLLAAGFDDFVILEKADGVGGTWRHNRYPGCECDVPSHLYSFSFAPNSDWVKPYAEQPEILDYLERCAADHGVLSHCRFETPATAARWDDERGVWTIECGGGAPIEARVLVGAIGMFNEPAIPEIEGLDTFRGSAFHSARWETGHDFHGERVGVIGSAASAVQLVPRIVEEADRVHLFQRTANWVLPKPDEPYTDEEIARFREDPSLIARLRAQTYANVEGGLTFENPAVLAQREAIGLAAIEVVEDPEVRAKLRPQHPFGCKRPLLSNDYFAAFNRPNLELVTEAVEEVRKSSVITAEGTERQVDTLILATGFQTTKYLTTIDVTGRDGLRLDDAWSDGAQAYVGVTTAGFPNMYMLYGPNTNNGSIITMIEHQVDHVLRHLERLASDELASIEVRPEAMAAYNDELQRALEGVGVWHAGCNGYYRTESGRIVTQWPMSMAEYGRRTSNIDWADFDLVGLDT